MECRSDSSQVVFLRVTSGPPLRKKPEINLASNISCGNLSKPAFEGSAEPLPIRTN